MKRGIRNSIILDDSIERTVVKTHSRFAEAEQLLETLNSWSEEEIEELPELYQKKAKEYQSLLQDGVE
ncbi:hypothetical protein ACOZ4N_00480 (plasmid) [Halorientalis pallida]|uniref:hypothetical protein n=1 Tax=Halorientalis pallida TaxID=2479928 RepID=UPI003C700DA9